MIKHIARLSVAGLLVFASVGFAQQYTMELTGSPVTTVGSGMYTTTVGPYTGSIWQGLNASTSSTPIYSGYIICDDFADDVSEDVPWNATATNAADVSGSNVLFSEGNDNGTEVTNQQEVYNAVAWLANQLVLPANATDSIAQTNYSVAIWDILDPSQVTAADIIINSTEQTLITTAFQEAVDGYQGSNVTVYTPYPATTPGTNSSQEFLVVPEAPTPALVAADLLGLMSVILFLRRRKFRPAQ